MTGTDPWMRPNVKPTWGANWDEDEGKGDYPNSYYFYLPRICNHCDDPACLAACSRNAIYKRQEDGIVLIDQERCRGYRYCVTACPYKKVYFNERISKSEKCIFCYPRIEKGLPMACARQCVGRIRWVGYRDDEAGPIHLLVEKYKVAPAPAPRVGHQAERVLRAADVAAPARLPTATRRPIHASPSPTSKSCSATACARPSRPSRRSGAKKANGEGSELMDTLIGFKHHEMFKLS